MPRYEDRGFSPPAPVAIVSVSKLDGSGDVTGVPMMIDSGADVTLLPRKHIASLIADEAESQPFELEGFDGTRTTATSVKLALRVEGRLFHGEFLVLDQEVGILGRNVMNRLRLMLDGPNLKWEVVR